MTTRQRHDTGVVFAATADGSRSSTHAGRSILAAAAAPADPALADRVGATSDWRKGYIPLFASVVEVGARSEKEPLQIAEAGLASLHDHVTFAAEDGELPLGRALAEVSQEPLGSATLEGDNPRVRELVVPYRGEALSGDALLRRIDGWRRAGVMEPSAATALGEVVRHPEWLDLRDRTFVLLGASSQMGALELLSAWGAHVVAVDLPREHLWDNIFKLVRRGAGRCTVPVRSGGGPAADTAGMDLLTETPRTWQWLQERDEPPIFCNFVYADGARFVQVAAAADALITKGFERWPEAGLAYLATPTDVFAVPGDVVEEVRSGKARLRVVKTAVRPLTLGRTFVPSYRHVVTGGDGSTWGLADALVTIQGANYALAKSLQRWRASIAHEDGRTVSSNVAPATRTVSVVKNRLLAAAYRGAGAFGIEIFEPETSRAVMAALLVHDLHNRPETRHPYDLFARGAVHGGLWRLPYEPRSVLPLALVLGSLKRH